jgi:hypothetical protein
VWFFIQTLEAGSVGHWSVSNDSQALKWYPVSETSRIWNMFQTTRNAQKLLSRTLHELRTRSSRLYSHVESQMFRRNISLPSSEFKSKPCKKTGVDDNISVTRSWIWCSHRSNCEVLSWACRQLLPISSLVYISTLRIEDICSSETSDIFWTTRLYNPPWERQLQLHGAVFTSSALGWSCAESVLKLNLVFVVCVATPRAAEARSAEW